MKPQSYTLRALRASHSATRTQFKARGGYVAPQLRHETAERVIRAVIRRIEWPRHGAPITLSYTDKADAMGAGMQACVQARFFDHGIMSLRVIRAIRNRIQGPECLRMRRTWEALTDSPADVAAQTGFMTEYEEAGPRLTLAQRDMAREIMRTLRAARSADASRKREAAFRSHRFFFFIVLGQLTERTTRAMTQDAFWKCAQRFRDYLADGAAHLRAHREPVNLGEHIMDALAANAFA